MVILDQTEHRTNTHRVLQVADFGEPGATVWCAEPCFPSVDEHGLASTPNRGTRHGRTYGMTRCRFGMRRPGEGTWCQVDGVHGAVDRVRCQVDRIRHQVDGM